MYCSATGSGADALPWLCCQKTELEDLSQEVSNLQNSIGVIIDQYQHLLDSISTIIYGMNEEDFNLKAYKMGQIYSLFDAIARQPEASDILCMKYLDFIILLRLFQRQKECENQVGNCLVFSMIAK